MLAAVYVGLHALHADEPQALKHRAYTATLRAPPTPHLWTDAERALLAGTNLAGAVETQAREWRAEAETVREVLKEEGFTWELYAALNAHVSSRAFPSALLRLPSGSETSAASTPVEESHPVLLPGLDLLNHKRGQAITWLSAKIAGAAADVPAISFVSPGQPPGQVYNNYGARGNESLLLGYGFVLAPSPDTPEGNPDDTLVLQLGGMNPEIVAALEKQGIQAGQRFEVRRDGVLPQDLVRTVRVMMADSACACCGGDGHEHGDEDAHEHEHGHNHDDHDDEDEHAAHEKEVAELELELDVLGMLGSMLEDKLSRLEDEPEAAAAARPEIARMARIYRQGQVAIAEAALTQLAERVERVETLLADGPTCPCGC
ncbi:uncharacterized protein COLE_04376 [Cutaneotrichosporon oleaginosum]|uniref:uncharacterized protein n=1 Tax=Cutaneotrichosporon oleaginosum TaxID=879819 RepID=UPI00132372DF|nr:hypothetical protein COLE_04376 [Cutaneotrichosporon oleaginosum]